MRALNMIFLIKSRGDRFAVFKKWVVHVPPMYNGTYDIVLSPRHPLLKGDGRGLFLPGQHTTKLTTHNGDGCANRDRKR